MQKMLYFKFNLIYPEISWSGSKICKKKYLLILNGLETLRQKNILSGDWIFYFQIRNIINYK